MRNPKAGYCASEVLEHRCNVSRAMPAELELTAEARILAGKIKLAATKADKKKRTNRRMAKESEYASAPTEHGIAKAYRSRAMFDRAARPRHSALGRHCNSGINAA